MSYSISHHLCNCNLTSIIYWLPVGTHVSGTDPRFDPEEQLASAVADFGRALAKMKCPSKYLSGLTKYVVISSILPIPVAINGYILYCRCIKHVVVNMPNMFELFSLPFYRQLGIIYSGSTCPMMLWRPRFNRTLIMHANVYDQDQGLTGRYHNTTLKT